MDINTEEGKFVGAQARKVIGKYLADIRAERKQTYYAVMKTSGLTIDQIKGIESGDKNYSIDSFLAYTAAVDCYFYLASREDKKESPHDLDDLAKQSKNPI